MYLKTKLNNILMTDKDSTPYEELPTNEQPAYSYYVIPTDNKKKKQCGGGCCCLMLVTFFLCFFLIPRTPTVQLEEILLSTQSVGKFKFKNNNYYDIKWKHPDISLYWIPYNGQTVGQVCYGEDDPCDSEGCIIKLGEFKLGDSFSTKAKSTKNVEMPVLSTTNQELACTSWMVLNPYEGRPQRLMTSGEVKAKSSINNFGNVKVSKSYYYF